MNVLIAMIAGLAGGALSAAATFFITLGVCRALHVSDREGASGYLAMYLGLLVGLVGLILSIVMTLRFRGQSGGAIWAQAPLAVGGIVAMAAVGMYLYYNAHDHPIITNGAPPVMQFQLQAPSNANLPDAQSIKVQLQSGDSRAEGQWDAAQAGQVDGRPVLTGHLELFVKTSQRMLVFDFPGQVNQLFNLRLPASPLAKKYQKWSDWQSADFMFTPASNVGQKVTPENAYRIRYLVEGVEP
jgi:hypothetical protein